MLQETALMDCAVVQAKTSMFAFRKMKLKITIIFIIIVANTAAKGEMNEGELLLDGCTKFIEEKFMTDGGGYCLGSTTVFFELWVTLQKTGRIKKVVCFPDGMTTGQGARVVVKYLEENPAKLHLSITGLIGSAFMEAFPCTEQKSTLQGDSK